MTITERYSQLRQSFDRRADQYMRNPLTHWIGHSELTALKEMIPPPKKTGEYRALDFGCGTGRVTAMLLEMKYKVTGYDISPGMLERARSAMGDHPEVLFTSTLDAVEGQWPLIVALGVLDYYKDTTPLWSEWSRLLAPGGILLVTAPNARSPLAWIYAWISRFTCQAHVTAPEWLNPAAEAQGFSMTGLRTVFPRYRWGHTIVMSFRLNTS